MSRYTVTPAVKVACLGVLMTLAACGSDSNPPVTEPGPVTPEVGLQGGDECQAIARLPGQARAILAATTSVDECEAGGDDGVRTLAVGDVVTGSLAATEEIVFKVPAGAEIILTSDSGDADLYLMKGPVLNDETIVCNGASPYKEHNCSADEGDLHALVYGREDATYTLSTSTDCSVESINRWVYRNMVDYYLYADRVPAVNPAAYASPEELVRDIRFEQLDPYSNVQNAVQQEDFQEQGRAVGFGYRWRPDASGNARVTRVYNDSEFGRAGIRRGDIIVSIDGELWADLTNSRYNELVGDGENPRQATWEIVKGVTGDTEFIPMTISEFTANTVIYAETFVSDSVSAKVGYLVFDGFIRTSEQELDAAIARFADQDITELVLDLRYNPGGLISIARRLASQIAGPSIEDQLLVRYQYNGRYRDVDFDYDAVEASPTLNLNRLLVLTTDRTASSSELVINSLRPFMEVITFGQKTLGKAFISAPKTFCDKNLNAMEAEGVNANGVSVAGGIPADCYAADDVTRDYGDESGSIEGMFGASLDYLVNGTCATGPTFASGPYPTNSLTGDSLPLPAAILDWP